jgi:hypothetical protein
VPVGQYSVRLIHERPGADRGVVRRVLDEVAAFRQNARRRARCRT